MCKIIQSLKPMFYLIFISRKDMLLVTRKGLSSFLTFKGCFYRFTTVSTNIFILFVTISECIILFTFILSIEETLLFVVFLQLKSV